MECPECHARIPDMYKFCPECGARLTASGSVAKIEDSVVMRSPGAGSNYAPVINLSNKEQNILRCPNCDMEISKENRPLKCLECGAKFCEYCEEHYRPQPRQRGEKPLCYKCFTSLIKEESKVNSEPSLRNKTFSEFIPGTREFDYDVFFDDVRKMIVRELPASGYEPDGHIWYRIPAGIEGAHFEWYFELYKWRKLGVELHFETRNRNWNQDMLSEMAKYKNLIEKQTGERVYIQRNWGRTRDWSRLYLANTHLDNVDELKKWAAEKMVIFYRILQPKLKELR